MTDERFLKSDERAIYSLRALYRKYGYLPYKMNKFEEYELYVRNKDFLVSDRVITFNDTDGSLMALKPDVTLSIVKNGDDVSGGKQKVCYNENVYRVSDSSGRFREIMQSGLECIGDIDAYDIYEVIYLAAQSLAQISDSYILEVSHLGVLSAVLEEVCDSPEFVSRAVAFIAEKNCHDLKKLCADYGLSSEDTEKAATLVTVYGDRNKVVSALKPICGSRAAEALEQLSLVNDLLDSAGIGDKVIFDFSVVNDMNYYNGVVFRGFLNGVCGGVISGGQYDSLMRKLGRNSSAVGFAIYLDRLEQLQGRDNASDVDVLLLYDDATDKKAVAEQVRALAEQGIPVSAQKTVPAKLKYDRIIDMRGASC